MDSLKGWKTSQLPLLSALSSELTVQRENLIYHLGDEWKGLVIWRLPTSKGKTSSENWMKFFNICVRCGYNTTICWAEFELFATQNSFIKQNKLKVSNATVFSVVLKVQETLLYVHVAN